MSRKIRIMALVLTLVMLIGVVPLSAFAVNPYFTPLTDEELIEKKGELDHNAVPSYKYGQVDIDGYTVNSVTEQEDPDGVKYLEFSYGGKMQVNDIGYSIADMKENEISYSFSFRKKPGAPILSATYIALENDKTMNGGSQWAKINFFDILANGDMVQNDTVVGTITEDKVTTVNFVIDFEDAKLRYYDENGNVEHQFNIPVPTASGATTLMEYKSLVSRYFLWFQTEAVTDGVLLIYDITITQGNAFEAASSETPGAVNPVPPAEGEPGNSVAFNVNGGTMTENVPESYDPAIGLILPTPEAPVVDKKPYVFGGWYTTETFDKGTRIDAIPAGATTNYNLYAKWNLVLANADIANGSNTTATQKLGNVTYQQWASVLPGTDEFGDYLDLTSGDSADAIISVIRDDISGLAAMSTNIVSYQFKFRKINDETPIWTCGNSSFDATVSGSYKGYNLFNINADGTVTARQDGKTVVATITTDEVAEINFVLDFNIGTITYYDKAGNVVASFTMTPPSGASTDPTVWRTQVIKYVLYTNMGKSEGTTRNYGVTVQEGNMFDIAGEYPPENNEIVYVTNGGTLPEDATVTFDPATETILSIPTKQDAKFVGWYTTPTFDDGTLVDRVAAGISGSCTVYARWQHIYVNASAEAIAETELESTRKKLHTLNFNANVTTKSEPKYICTLSVDKTDLNTGTATDNGDTLELTRKETFDDFRYYASIPEGAVAVTDEAGNTIAYQVTTSPSDKSETKYKYVNNELTYYADFSAENTEFTSGYYTVHFSLQAGAGMNFNYDIVKVKYQLNGSDEVLEKQLLSVVMKNGVPYIHMAAHNENRDFILRSDISTEISVRFWLEGERLNFRIYTNDEYHSSGTKYGSEVATSYRILGIGTTFDDSTAWNEPLMTIGKVKTWNGNGYTTGNYISGYELADDGTVYRYEWDVPREIITGDAIVNTAGFVKLEGYSTTLGANLGMNFYAKLPATVTKAVITTAGESETVNVSDLTAEADGTYKFTSEVSSIQTREAVKINFYTAEDKEIPIVTDNAGYKTGYTTTVYKYAQDLIADAEQTDYVKAAAQALINYAAYAEKYFDKTGSFDISAAFADADTAAVEAVTADKVSGTVNGYSEKLGEVNLVLDSTTKIRINLSAKAEVASEKSNIKYIENGEKFYIDICDIDAKNLDTVYTLTVDGTEVKISVLGVAAIVVGDADTYGADFANLMKALYLYSVACEKLA